MPDDQFLRLTAAPEKGLAVLEVLRDSVEMADWEQFVKAGARLVGSGQPHLVLDLRGLRCPLPALKTRKALTRLAAGDRLVVECTDPLSTLDIPNLINQTGDVLEEQKTEPGLFVFRILKKASDAP